MVRWKSISHKWHCLRYNGSLFFFIVQQSDFLSTLKSVCKPFSPIRNPFLSQEGFSSVRLLDRFGHQEEQLIRTKKIHILKSEVFMSAWIILFFSQVVCHMPILFCCSLVKSQPIILCHEEHQFRAKKKEKKKIFGRMNFNSTTLRSLQLEIFAHCLHFQARLQFCFAPSFTFQHQRMPQHLCQQTHSSGSVLLE